MLSDKSKLLAIIQLVEDSLTELKAVYFAGGKIRKLRQDNLADELAAFANSPASYLQPLGSSKGPITPDQSVRLFQQRRQSRLIRFDESASYHSQFGRSTRRPVATCAPANQNLDQ